MMIKITSTCTMGCSHCMNDAKPEGRDMSTDTLIKTLDFLKKNNLGKFFILSGGEPLEHEDFKGVINTIVDWQKQNNYIIAIIVTTNGEKIQDDRNTYVSLINQCKKVGIRLEYQVSADSRYYPRRIKTHRHVFREDGFVLVDNCITHMYPQGRAKDNNYPYQALGPKCFNVRAIARQLDGCSLAEIEAFLVTKMKFCTPHISIDGEIKLGESDLCPVCATIEDEPNIIMRKIRRFKCSGCQMLIDALPPQHRKILE